MEATTKKLQELGAFVLAGAHEPHQLCIMAEMIRAACDYRWVGIYKITRGDFIIVAKTGKCPPAYPRLRANGRAPRRKPPKTRPYATARAGFVA